MKKLIAIGIAMLIVWGINTLSYAQVDPIETSKTINISLDVNPTFGFQIWTTEYTQALEAVSAGGAALGSVHVYVSSNHTNPWMLNAGSDGLIGQTQITPDTLPIQISTFDGGANPSPLAGTVVTDLVLTSVAQAIYTAGAGEYPCAGLQVDSVFAVTTTSSTKEDSYAGTMIVTLTE